MKPYEPSRSLLAKVSRRLTPLRARRMHSFELTTSIVSITFDDFPISAWENGGKRLEQNGLRGTFYVASGLRGGENHHGAQFNAEHITELLGRGHEIGGHSFSHTDCTDLSVDAVMAEIERNEEALKKMGAPVPCPTFAYPYGATTAAIKTRLQARYRAMRGILPGLHVNNVDLNQVRSFPLFSGGDLNTAIGAIETLKTRPAWVTLFAHDIRNDASAWGCTPDDFENVLLAIKNSGADVLTMSAALDRIGAPHV